MPIRRNELAGQHRDLMLDIDRLHVLTIAPDAALPATRMRRLLERELRDLAASLEQHFGFEESGAYLEAALEERPGLQHDADVLRRQHEEILERLDRLADACDEAELAQLKAGAADVLDLLGEHERSEVRLLQDATSRDLGGGD